MKKLLLMFVLFPLAVFSCFTCGSGDKTTIRIGMMGPLTGPWASEGIQMKNVLELIIDQTNDSGGVLGKKVELLVEDDEGDPQKAVPAAQNLAKSVKFVVGTYGSSITAASQPVFDSASVIQIANGSTSTNLTEKGYTNFFRTCPRDDQQAETGVSYIGSRGYIKVAILDDGTFFAVDLAASMKPLLQASGVEVVCEITIIPGKQDYTDILTGVRAMNPELVIYTGYYPEAGVMLKNRKAMGWDVPFLGSDATNSLQLVEIAGTSAAEGFVCMSVPLPLDLESVDARRFMNDYTVKYGTPPSSIYAILAGDAFRVIINAIQNTGGVYTERISEYLHKSMTSFDGYTGKISFNSAGDRIDNTYVMYKVNSIGDFVMIND